MRRRRFLTLPALAILPAQAQGAPWPLLAQGDKVILLRHAATVPGIGDPPGFRPGVCSTQRNLSQAGRRDAERIGAAFRKHAVPVSQVLSSHWCRCLDTARLAFGRVQPVQMLDSMFQDDDAARQRKLSALRDYLAANQGRGNLVMVTHDVNIRALFGKYVEQGDMVIAARAADGLKLEAVLPIASLSA